jgi:hypothetical protein
MPPTTELVPAPPPAAVPLRVQESPPLAVIGPCPKLSEALAAARDRCKTAVKDSKNTHHGYKYASADEVIATASEAMQSSGLALLPLREELVVLAAGNSACYALNRVLVLTHSSGEYTPLEIRGWPVVPDRGRPLDKAYAIALTSSLAYKLRDLLQMPRGDEHDDVAAQNDTATPPPPPPDAPRPANGSASRTVVPPPSQAAPASAPQAGPIGLSTVPASMTSAQYADMNELITALQLDMATVADKLVRLGYPNDPKKLSQVQADDVIRRLKRSKAASTGGTPAPAGGKS